MKKYNMNLFFISMSPWPIIMSMTIMNLFINIIIFINNDNSIFMYLNFFLMFILMLFWWNDIILESSFMGFHNNYIKNMTTFSMILFIMSEFFFFFGFFWSFFNFMLSPDIIIGSMWPYNGIKSMNFMSLPLMNSLLLVSSGCSVTLSHYSIMINKLNNSKINLFLTIMLGLMFIMFQLFEYYTSYFTISDGIFGSIFFLCTGFHGIHVIIGLIFLMIMLLRMLFNQFSSNNMMGFEFSIWYWHFVDLIWLYLYMMIYWLSS